MKVVILSVSVPDLVLPEEIVPAINEVLRSHPRVISLDNFFVRILDAYLVDGILEHHQKPEIAERPLPKKKKAS